MSLMGIGTNILGYANKKVNDRINLTLKKSNMSTLNCPEEVTLAENLIKIHPWFNMVKFAKTGLTLLQSELREQALKKDKVAVCGYHGWHDWYLSTVINDNDKKI